MSNATSVSDIERAEHLNYADSKGVKRVSVFNDGIQINAATDESVQGLGMTVDNALDFTEFDLNASAFSQTTDISNDFILDSIILNFSTSESKTITVTGADGTILWGGSVDTSLNNLGYNTTKKNFNLVFDQAFNGGDNITVSVTQLSSAGTMDCILKVKQGGAGLSGNPVLGAGSEVVGKVRLVTASGDEVTDDDSDCVNVCVQDQVTKSLIFTVNHKVSTTTLTLDTSSGDETITATTGHGILVGDQVALQEGENVFQAGVTAVSGDDITLDCPIDYPYTTSALLTREQINGNVNGSVTPVDFTIKPQTGQIWDIYEFTMYIESTGSADLTKFGDITNGLTNGILIRKKDGTYENIFCAKNNGDLYFRCEETEFLEKPYYSFKATFKFPEQTGVALRLNGNEGEFFEVLVRDNLSSLLRFNMFSTGHVIKQ